MRCSRDQREGGAFRSLADEFFFAFELGLALEFDLGFAGLGAGAGRTTVFGRPMLTALGTRFGAAGVVRIVGEG